MTRLKAFAGTAVKVARDLNTFTEETILGEILSVTIEAEHIASHYSTGDILAVVIYKD